MSKIIGSHTPAQIKNLAINGALDFWQERAGNNSPYNSASPVTFYPADMWLTECAGPTTKVFAMQRSTNVPSQAQSGFVSTYSSVFTMTTAIPSPAAADIIIPFEYRMEGLDYEKIHAKTITVGFWATASIAGVYSVAILNSASTRSYVTTVTMNGANTYEFKTVTIPLDTSGTWLFDTGIGMKVIIGAMGGSSFQTSALNTWQAGAFSIANTAVNYMATAGATFTMTQLSIVEGPLGLGAKGFTRCGDSMQVEMGMCNRYYEKSYRLEDTPGSTNGFYGAKFIISGATRQTIDFITKRVTPTVTFYHPGTGAVNQFYQAGGSALVTVAEVGYNSVRFSTTGGTVQADNSAQIVIDARL